MNKIYVKIKNSNINSFSPKKYYSINLLKCIGSGSYGLIFLTDIKNYVVKIIVDIDDQDDRLSDFKEIDVIDKLIQKKITVNNGEYAHGELVNENKYNLMITKKEEGRTRRSSSIFLHLNLIGDANPLESKISKRNKTKSFYLYETNSVIIMPLFVPFYDYLDVCKKNFRNEIVLCNILKLLIDSVDELFEMNFINIDLKMNNIMIDKNNNLKIIDFGMVLSSKRLMEKMNHDIKYYIWPKNRDFSYSMILSYMIVVFILEILYEQYVFEIHKNNTVSKVLINNVEIEDFLSPKFKEIIVKVLEEGIEYNNFKFRINQLLYSYGINKGKLPNLYNILLSDKGIDLF